MPYYCTVPRCTSMAGKAKNVSFHQFPRDEDLAKLWNNILKRGKPYTKYSKVCSLHFKPEDYTITSAGKNKGQWRTLRKDAIPSQNLPSDVPATYQRRQSSAWMSNVSNNAQAIAPQLQQLAQAIYMQTMLAMQVAGVTESVVNPFSNGLPQNLLEQESQIAQTSTSPGDNSSMSDNETNSEQSFNGNEHSLLQDNNTISSYKCDDCSKCFKDPDVFILHKRSHNNVNLQSGKENFDLNSLKPEMLKSNPILANLLKDTVEKNIFDTNLLEKQLIASFSSVDNYLSSDSKDDDFDNCDSSLGDNLDDNNLVIDESVA